MKSDHEGPRIPLPSGILASTAMALALFAAQPGKNNQADMRTASEQYRLAPIEAGQDWPLPEDDNDERTRDQIKAEVLVDEHGRYKITKEMLPTGHAVAFRMAIGQPLVRRAAETGKLTAIQAVTSEKDNGYWWANRGGHDIAALSISNNQSEDRYLNDMRMPAQILNHESVHAENEDWAAFLGSAWEIKDPNLQQRVQDVEYRCQEVRDDIYHEFTAKNRNEIVDALLESAQRLDEAAQRFSPDAVGSYARTNLSYFMRKAARTMLRNDRRYVDGQLRGFTCNPGDIFAMLYDFKESYDRLGDYEAGHPEVFKPYEREVRPIMDANDRLETLAENYFGCFTDRNVINFAYDLHLKSGGHPEDNPNEAMASLMMSLFLSPQYVRDCMRDMQPERQKTVANYVDALFRLAEYASPNMVEVIKRDPEVEHAIYEITTLAGDYLWGEAVEPNSLLTESGFGVKLPQRTGLRAG